MEFTICRVLVSKHEETVRSLRATIGELPSPTIFLSRRLEPLTDGVGPGMGERSRPTLSVGARRRLLSIAQSTFYYAP